MRKEVSTGKKIFGVILILIILGALVAGIFFDKGPEAIAVILVIRVIIFFLN